MPFGLPAASQVRTTWEAAGRPRSELATSCWKEHGWLVQTAHEEEGSRVTRCGHMGCSRRWEPPPASAWSAGVVPAQTPQMSCLPPSPVPCPGASRCWTALLCSACGVPMRPAAHRGPSACFPAPVDSVQRRCKERSMCRWGPRAFASSLAARTSSRLCRRKSTCTFTLLAVHAADVYEEGDGSFQARLHKLLQLCGAVPSAPPHDVLLSASVQREDCISGVSALVAVC